jgi:DNA/RNA endonuclease YhcR with UshA esterase domain
MNNTQIVTIENLDGTTTEHIIIDRGNGEFTSMLKSTYDEMIAAQSTPSVE